MASSINASLTAGVVTTADTSGVLNIQTAGTTAISIDASQAVSFTNSPTVTGGTANGVAYLNGSKVLTTGSALTYDGTNLTVNTGTVSATYGKLTVAGGISITPDSSSKFQIGRYSAGAPYSYIKMGSTSSGLKFTYPADSVDLMTLSSTGALALYGASTSANGVGITFPATQSASTDANTLDDYEEGTWTPTIGGSGSDPTSVSYSTQEGTYTKIGNRVFVEFFLSFTTFTGGSNAFYIRGLPFTGSGNGDGPMKIENVSLTAGKTYLVGTISASVISPNQVGSSTTWNGLTIGTNVTTSATVKYFTGSLCYKI